MDTPLSIGLSHTAERVVGPDDTASRYGSGLLPVLATPALVALMEQAAMRAVQPYLPQGYGTVGTQVSIAHTKATGLGMRVWSSAELVGVEGRKLTFSLRAWDDQGEIGSGTHCRFVIDNKRFMERIGARG